MVKKSIQLGGRTLSLETGRIAKQADGSALVQYGDTVVLVAVVSSKTRNDNADFFPLSVEYKEKLYAAGKVPGGFFKREARPSEKEILSARLIDRPIRPMFPKGYLYETQVHALVLSHDGENDGDCLGAIGASLALNISDIPFSESVASVKVGRIDGEYILNPTFAQIEKSEMELVVAGTKDSIAMVEGEAHEADEETLLGAISFGHAAIIEICKLQDEIIAELKKPTREFVLSFDDPELSEKIVAAAGDEVLAAAHIADKQERNNIRKAAAEKALAALGEEHADKAKYVSEVLDKKLKAEMRKMVLTQNRRLDGRDTTTIRPITIEMRVLPRPHGSALFTRGQTQALGVCTLGSKYDEQRIDALEGNFTKQFMLHYNFPPFSTGEVKKALSTSRREIGHGNLAERAIEAVLPAWDQFPYTIRVVSEVMESNGSSSMATVCAASLSLMDAGVPMKRAVAGIAMGLIKEGDQAAILTDILGDEDALGDMDFKVAGTREGITAFQMDIKIQGISIDLMRKALLQARDGRWFILGLMETAMPKPSEKLSDFAPKIVHVRIDQEKIGALIGPGGKNIRDLQRRTGCTLDIDDEGVVVISGIDIEGVRDAFEYVYGLTVDPEPGKVYRGKITRIVDFGAFVEILPGREGLLHISNIAHERVNKVEDYLKLGDLVEVKLLAVDAMGKMDLSRKALLPDENGVIGGTRPQTGKTHSGPPRGGRSGGGGHRDRR